MVRLVLVLLPKNSVTKLNYQTMSMLTKMNSFALQRLKIITGIKLTD